MTNWLAPATEPCLTFPLCNIGRRLSSQNLPMEAAYTSQLLHHFVGFRAPSDHEQNWETLVKVLESGCVSHPPHVRGHGETSYTVDFNRSLHDEQLLVPRNTCYADIPKDSLAVHVRKYGRFGIAFDRASLIRSGARPVMYVPKSTNEFFHSPNNGKYMLDDIEAVYRGLNEYIDERFPGDSAPIRRMRTVPHGEREVLHAVKALVEKYFIAFIKPFDSELLLDERANYYMEREWRKYGNLLFSDDDVEQVWVAPGYVDVAREAFPRLAAKVLELR